MPIPLGLLAARHPAWHRVGVVNGLITTVARVPSLVVTLATLYIVRGVDGVRVNGKINARLPARFHGDRLQVPAGRSLDGDHRCRGGGRRGVRDALLPIGRDLYAIGSNPEAAALAGIPSGRRVFTAFLISGGLAGLGGGCSWRNTRRST